MGSRQLYLLGMGSGTWRMGPPGIWDVDDGAACCWSFIRGRRIHERYTILENEWLICCLAHPFHNRSAEQQATREALLASRLQTETTSSALIPSRGAALPDSIAWFTGLNLPQQPALDLHKEKERQDRLAKPLLSNPNLPSCLFWNKSIRCFLYCSKGQPRGGTPLTLYILLSCMWCSQVR